MFSRTSIKLTEESKTSLDIEIGYPRGTGDDQKPVAALDTLMSDSGVDTDFIEFAASPAGVLGTAVGECGHRDTPNVVAWLTGGAEYDTNRGVWETSQAIDDIGGANGMAVPLEINACEDMSGFNNSEIVLSFVAKALEKDVGDIAAGPSAVIEIESDEPAPTLSFSPTDVTIDEGGSTETVLIAEGEFGSEVGMVKLSVEGDAMVGLYMGMDKLEEMDGHVYVDLGTSNSARLTARSYSDPDLMDGDTAFKAWKLVEGATDGANIGDGYWFRVDVVGSTAVPALPLIGQLLLALFLMAGGARLYRRRQG